MSAYSLYLIDLDAVDPATKRAFAAVMGQKQKITLPGGIILTLGLGNR